MSYTGFIPQISNMPRDSFTGDGTTTGFTLTYSPGSVNGILLIVGGIVQPTTAYTVSGTTLTISSAPPNRSNY